MSAATAPGPVARAPALLFAAAIVVLPVTGLTGLETLGELKGSASVYVLLAAMAAFVLRERLGAVEVSRPVLALVAVLVAWLGASAAVNYEVIATSVLDERSGASKLVNASIMLGFGIVLAVVSGRLLRDPRDLRAFFVTPLALAVLVCSAFAVPELMTWVSPAATGLYDATTALFHTQETEQGRVIGRLTSITFEAPDLAYFAALSLPWLLLGYRWTRLEPPPNGHGSSRAVAILALACGLALALASNSRTGFLMLAAFGASEGAVWLGLRRLRVPAAVFTVALTACLAAVVTALAVTLPGVGTAAVTGEDVSTITRSALLSAQFAIFADNPLFGVGFGQYGFHVQQLLPSWAWSSYEIERFFETHGELPPAFNVFGRVGSELGVPGLVIWFGFWIAAAHRAAAAAADLPARSLALAINAALLSSTVCFLVGGISTDAFRRPETWVLVAITGLYAGAGPRMTGAAR